MLEYLGSHFLSCQRVLPARDHFEGTVKAELYRGLWIARCPEEDCASSATVTSLDPIYACHVCGVGWFHVKFPINRAKIEAEVMKRKIPRKGLVHANWIYGETLKMLRDQTQAAEA